MRPGQLLSSTIFVALGVLAGQEALAQYESEITSSSPETPQFTFMGFGDVSYISRDNSDRDGFVVGQAVAHMTASLGQSFSVFGEVTATAKDSEYSMEVERMIVKYDFSDILKLSAGRYHTPVGYWNSAFHHGAWLQTTSNRPEVFRFGSKIVPIHFVGILAEGTWTKSPLGLSYQAGFGNGRHANIARAGDAGDINGDNAWMVQFRAAPEAFYGLNLGVGIYADDVSPQGEPAVEETTVSAYGAWTGESPEIIVEYLHSNHELTSDRALEGDVTAWYAQFAYRLKDDWSAWKPYARFEHTDVDNADPLLGAEGLDYEGAILGVRWDFNSHAALKVEYRSEEFDNQGRESNFQVQLSFVLASF